MSENPYAPPTADLAGGTPTGGGRGDIDIGQALSEAWANTWANFPLWLGVSLAFFLMAAAATVTILGIFLLLPVLGYGFVRFGLRMHDGGAEFKDLFAGFEEYGKTLVAMLVAGIIVSLIGMLGQSVQLIGDVADIEILSLLGGLIYLAWSLIVLPRFYFAYLYVVDQDVAPVEAVQQSWERTAPVMWKLVALAVLSYVILLAGLIAFVIGLIPATVVSYLMWVSAYRQLEGGPSSA